MFISVYLAFKIICTSLTRRHATLSLIPLRNFASLTRLLSCMHCLLIQGLWFASELFCSWFISFSRSSCLQLLSFLSQVLFYFFLLCGSCSATFLSVIDSPVPKSTVLFASSQPSYLLILVAS